MYKKRAKLSEQFLNSINRSFCMFKSIIKRTSALLALPFAMLSAHALQGDTLIPTPSGNKAIKDVQVGDLVLSKDEISNELSYQAVTHQNSTQYPKTVYLNVVDDVGNTQTITTNQTHPFFAQTTNLIPSSEGYVYQGSIENANWVDASNLKVGDKLLSQNNEWQTIQSINITNEPITAYDLTVNNNHTFFVSTNGKYGVWVHNNTKLSDKNQTMLNNLSQPLSKNTIEHILDRHDFYRVQRQINTVMKNKGKTKEEVYAMLNVGGRTFFNKNWSEQTSIKAVEYVKQDAIKNKVLQGDHTTNYLGEKITINISKDGKVSTAYGDKKYALKEF